MADISQKLGINIELEDNTSRAAEAMQKAVDKLHHVMVEKFTQSSDIADAFAKSIAAALTGAVDDFKVSSQKLVKMQSEEAEASEKIRKKKNRRLKSDNEKQIQELKRRNAELKKAAGIEEDIERSKLKSIRKIYKDAEMDLQARPPRSIRDMASSASLRLSSSSPKSIASMLKPLRNSPTLPDVAPATAEIGTDRVSGIVNKNLTASLPMTTYDGDPPKPATVISSAINRKLKSIANRFNDMQDAVARAITPLKQLVSTIRKLANVFKNPAIAAAIDEHYVRKTPAQRNADAAEKQRLRRARAKQDALHKIADLDMYNFATADTGVMQINPDLSASAMRGFANQETGLISLNPDLSASAMRNFAAQGTGVMRFNPDVGASAIRNFATAETGIIPQGPDVSMGAMKGFHAAVTEELPRITDSVIRGFANKKTGVIPQISDFYTAETRPISGFYTAETLDMPRISASMMERLGTAMLAPIKDKMLAMLNQYGVGDSVGNAVSSVMGRFNINKYQVGEMVGYLNSEDGVRAPLQQRLEALLGLQRELRRRGDRRDRRRHNESGLLGIFGGGINAINDGINNYAKPFFGGLHEKLYGKNYGPDMGGYGGHGGYGGGPPGYFNSPEWDNRKNQMQQGAKMGMGFLQGIASIPYASIAKVFMKPLGMAMKGAFSLIKPYMDVIMDVFRPISETLQGAVKNGLAPFIDTLDRLALLASGPIIEWLSGISEQLIGITVVFAQDLTDAIMGVTRTGSGFYDFLFGVRDLAVGLYDTAIGPLTKSFQIMTEDIFPRFGSILSKIGPSLGYVMTTVTAVLADMGLATTQFIADLMPSIEKSLPHIVTAVSTVAGGLAKTVGFLFRYVLLPIQKLQWEPIIKGLGFLAAVFNTVVTVAKKFYDLIASDYSFIANSFLLLGQGINKAAIWLAEMIESVPILNTLFGSTAYGLRIVGDYLEKVGAGIKKFMLDPIGAVYNLLIKMRGVFRGFARAATNAIIPSVTPLLRATDAIANSDSGNGQSWLEYAKSVVPGLATGGIVKSDSLVNVGEGGVAEAVVPLTASGVSTFTAGVLPDYKDEIAAIVSHLAAIREATENASLAAPEAGNVTIPTASVGGGVGEL